MGQPSTLRKAGWLLVQLGLASAAACGPLGAAPTATPEVLADCFWSAEAVAWVDENGNGTREAGEPPLAGVEVNFNLNFFSSATTDAAGEAHLSGMHPGGCDPALANSVVARPPAGYTPTTPMQVPFTQERVLYEFGFQPAA